jgi:hypothetical protein
MTINPMAKRPRRTSVQSHIEKDGEALSCTRGTRLSRLSNAWGSGGAPTGKQNGNCRHGTRTKEAIQAVRYISLLSRLARRSDLENAMRQSMAHSGLRADIHRSARYAAKHDVFGLDV